MTPRRTLHSLAAAAAAAALAAPAAAQADTLVAASPGAQHLASAGGYHAWSSPRDDGRFDLVVLAPDGTQSRPVAPFGAPVHPQIGSDRFGARDRRLLVAYSRCEGTSDIAGCDVHALDLRTGREERVAALASRTYSETAPSLQYGQWAFVRRGGGPRKGLYAWSEGQRPRRISTTLARETASTASRVAYTYNSSRGGGVAIRRLSGEGGALVVASRLDTVPNAVSLTRYNAAWLAGGRAFQTTRFAGSGGPYSPQTKPSTRDLPAGTVSLSLGSSIRDAFVLTGEGLVRPEPRLFD